MTSVQNPYALYTAGESYSSVQPAMGPGAPPAPVHSSRPAGMEGLVAAQRAKASRIGADVKAGFRDLQVQLLARTFPPSHVTHVSLAGVAFMVL